MQVARGLARFEGRDPPTSRQLKRSPYVGRHLRSEGNDVSRRKHGGGALSGREAQAMHAPARLRSAIAAECTPFPSFIIERASG